MTHSSRVNSGNWSHLWVTAIVTWQHVLFAVSKVTCACVCVCVCVCLRMNSALWLFINRGNRMRNVSYRKAFIIDIAVKREKWLNCFRLVVTNRIVQLNVPLFLLVFTKTMTTTASNTFQTFWNISCPFEVRWTVTVCGCFSGTLCCWYCLVHYLVALGMAGYCRVRWITFGLYTFKRGVEDWTISCHASFLPEQVS